MILNGRFLQFRPSQMAAASLILSIKTYDEFESGNELSSHISLAEAERLWNSNVEELTGLRFSIDIKSVYCKLIRKVRKSSTE